MDSSWKLLQSTFNTPVPDPRARKPLRLSRPTNRKAPPNHSPISLKPITFKHIKSAHRHSSSQAHTKRRTVPDGISITTASVSRAPNNKENHSDEDSIHFDPDQDGYLAESFCKSPARSVQQPLNVSITRRTSRTPRSPLIRLSDPIEVPETQQSTDEPTLAIDTNTDEMLSGAQGGFSGESIEKSPVRPQRVDFTDILPTHPDGDEHDSVEVPETQPIFQPLNRLSPAQPHRVDFANILRSHHDEHDSIEVPETQPSIDTDLDIDHDIEVPETQQPTLEPTFSIDEDTEDMLIAIPGPTPTERDAPTTDAAHVADIPRIESYSSSGGSLACPTSAPHNLSPRRVRRRPRAGGLLEQLKLAVNRSKSRMAFWLHERRCGLVSQGTVVRVLQVHSRGRRTADAAAAGTESGSGGIGCIVRVLEENVSTGAETMMLVIDGDLKVCDRLTVGTRLEVDLRMATRLMVRDASSGAAMAVYPRVQCVRELRTD